MASQWIAASTVNLAEAVVDEPLFVYHTSDTALLETQILQKRQRPALTRWSFFGININNKLSIHIVISIHYEPVFITRDRNDFQNAIDCSYFAVYNIKNNYYGDKKRFLAR